MTELRPSKPWGTRNSPRFHLARIGAASDGFIRRLLRLLGAIVRSSGSRTSASVVAGPSTARPTSASPTATPDKCLPRTRSWVDGSCRECSGGPRSSALVSAQSGSRHEAAWCIAREAKRVSSGGFFAARDAPLASPGGTSRFAHASASMLLAQSSSRRCVRCCSSPPRRMVGSP